MFYRVVLIWKIREGGWTETYYREAASGRLASYFGAQEELSPFLLLRPRGAQLQAVRAQEVSGLRRIFVRRLFFAFGEASGTPDVSSTSARLWLPFEGRSGRHVWLRGLADHFVNREKSGRKKPHPELVERLPLYNVRVRQLGLRGRRLADIGAYPWDEVRLIAAHPDRADVTRVTVRGELVAAPGDCVYFGGAFQCCGLRRELPYLVTDYDGATLDLAAAWPADLADFVPDQPCRVRRVVYDYPLLEAGELRDFSAFRVRAAYRPASWTPIEPRVPVDPCGQIVDYLRQAYTVQMRLWRTDPGASLRVKWYFPVEPPERQAIPFDHPFGSRAWELQSDYPPLIGEEYLPRPWYSGRPPVELRGVNFCGSFGSWYDGAGSEENFPPLNPSTDRACCCGPGAIVIAGGVAAGGSVTGQPDVEIMRGGVAAGGVLFAALSVAGGVAAGGSVFSKTEIDAPAGGTAGGGSVFSKTEIDAPAGGVAAGGVLIGNADQLAAGGSAAGGELLGKSSVDAPAGGTAGGGVLFGEQVPVDVSKLPGGVATGGQLYGAAAAEIAGGVATGGHLYGAAAAELRGGVAAGGLLLGALDKSLAGGVAAGGVLYAAAAAELPGGVAAGGTIFGPTVTVPCDMNRVSVKLRGALTRMGTCTCLPTTIDFLWDVSLQRWQSTTSNTGCGINTIDWYIRCNAGVPNEWRLYDTIGEITGILFSPPWSITFSRPNPSFCPGSSPRSYSLRASQI